MSWSLEETLLYMQSFLVNHEDPSCYSVETFIGGKPIETLAGKLLETPIGVSHRKHVGASRCRPTWASRWRPHRGKPMETL